MKHHDDPRTDVIRSNVEELMRRIEAARARGPHGARDVRLVVVTKAQPTSIFGPLAAAGVRDVGENRVQDAARRRPAAAAELVWHGIGHLQRNKARTAVRTFDVFHALDGLALARRLETLLAAEERVWPVYVQVNAAGDAAKHGVAPDEALGLLAALADLPHLRPVGFMTMARAGATDGELRATFGTLREIRDEAVRRGREAAPVDGLSMGMSGDFEIAVEEGATVVRVGRAVFRGVVEDAAPVASEHEGVRGAEGDPT